MDQYQLKKSIWCDTDYDDLCWHDSTIWSICPNLDKFEFALDLDYIFKWVTPSDEEMRIKFWVAPVTILFFNVGGVTINITSSQGSIEVDELHRENIGVSPNGELDVFRYRFICQEGEISITATGFSMFVRGKPILLDDQRLSLSQRGGINFAPVTQEE